MKRGRAGDRNQTRDQSSGKATRRELAEAPSPEPVEVPVFRGGTGPREGIDLTSNRGMREALDLVEATTGIEPV